MKKQLIRLSLGLILLLLFSTKVLLAQTNVPYWVETFTSPGCDLTPTSPTTNTSGYFTGNNSGSWWAKNVYRTTGIACANNSFDHVRFKNIAGGDSGQLVTPVVNLGIKEFHFTRNRTSRSYRIFVTPDTSAITTNWILVATLPSSASTATCVDTTVLINSATGKRLKIMAATGTDTDIDSIWLTNYSPNISPIAASVTVGLGGTYNSFTNDGGLFEAINSVGLTHNVSVIVISNTNELGTHSLNQFSPSYSLSIKPDAATLRTIEMVNPTRASDSLFKFNGADNVNIDGSFNGSGRYLLFRCANTNTDSSGSVFVFRNDARENTISNCIIESNSQKKPIVLLHETTGLFGNDGFTFYNNLVRESTGANSGGYYTAFLNLPHYSASYAQKNSRVTIRKNQFTGFSSIANSIYIVNSFFTGDSIIIDSNQIYRGSNYTIPNIQGFYTISLEGGSNATIANNSIGGGNSNRSGNPISLGGQFFGILISSTDTGNLTLVKNNRISNIVCLGQGSINPISVRADKIIIENNIIGGLENPWDTLQGSGTMISANPDGFFKPDTTFIRNNIVSHIKYIGKVPKDLTGISITKITSNSPEAVLCNNNLVSDLFSNSVAFNTGTGALTGINLDLPSGSRNAFCYNNIVRNLSHKTDTSRYNVSHIAGSISGIAFKAGINGAYIGQLYNNKIYNLTALNTNATDTGLFSTQINGIAFLQITGNLMVYNNQVSLVAINASPVRYLGISCIRNNSNFQGNLSIVYNSILLSGNSVVNGVNGYSATFKRELKQTVFMRNNIFVNARTGSNTNFAIVNDSMSANWTDTSCQHNLFISSNSNQMGLWTNRTNPLDFTAWKAASNCDSASTYYTTATLDPTLFFNDFANCDLSIKPALRNYVAAKGYQVSTTNIDWNGNARSSTKPSVGAFEYLYTSSLAPTVSTASATLIGITNVTLGGNVSDSGTASVSERGVVYATTSNPTTANTKVQMGNGLGTFSQNITGLTSATTYHVRAYAINTVGTSYGADSMFTTLIQPTIAPNVITASASLIGNNNATLGGNVSDSGTATVTERGIVFATTINPTTTDSKVQMGNGMGSYSQNITGLTPTTLYHVRAYAINSVGTSYGADSVFTTTAQPTFAPSVSTNNPTLIGISSATLGGTTIDSGTATITERGVVYSTSINPTTADTKMAMGSGLGNYSQNITGLTPSTTYHVRAYAINSVGTSYGADSVFTTLNAIVVPSLTTATPVLIGTHIATLGGEVTTNGGAPVTSRGVVYGLGLNPDTTGNKVLIGSGDGAFSQEVLGLSANTVYHVRAFAVNSAGIAYGADITFTTLSEPTFTEAKVYNAFSPDGDGLNDTWVIDNASDLAGHEIVVFNIFGQEVFHQTGYATPWDGTINGNLVPSGEYYYLIKGDKVNKKGAMLIRTK